MSLETVLAEDRRLCILRTLREAPDYRLNETLLVKALAYVGHDVGRDMVRADLEWLRQHGLLRTEALTLPSGELWLAHLTEDGDGVARGRHHPGVARPTPR